MNADFEVKKLKDLVKKLELQNQHLRNKTGKLGPGVHSRPIQHDLLLAGGESGDSNQLEGVSNDPRFRDVQKSNKCCWLFALEKQSSYEDPIVLIDWLRYELDHPPTQQLEYARREIISNIDAEQKNAVATDSSQYFNEKAASTKIELVRKSQPPQETFDNTVDYSYDSPPPAPQEDERGTSQGHVHHMPLPSHTMTSKYGLVDVSTMESASPSGLQRSRGASPARSSQAATYSRSHRSPTRRGQSPSRTEYSHHSPTRRGHSPARNTDFSHHSPTRRGDYSHHSPTRRGQSPLRTGENSYRSSVRRGQSPSRDGDNPYVSSGRRGQSPSRTSENAYRSSARRGQSPSRDDDDPYVSSGRRGQSPSRTSENAYRSSARRGQSPSRDDDDPYVSSGRRGQSPSRTGENSYRSSVRRGQSPSRDGNDPYVSSGRRGQSPSRTGENSYRSSVRRGQSPSRNDVNSHPSSRRRGQSPSRDNDFSHHSPTRRRQSPTRTNDDSYRSSVRRGQSPSTNGGNSYSSVRRGQSPSRNSDISHHSPTRRSQTPSRNSDYSYTSEKRGHSPSRSSDVSHHSPTRRGQSPSRSSDSSYRSSVRRGQSPSRNSDISGGSDHTGTSERSCMRSSESVTSKRFQSPSAADRVLTPAKTGMFARDSPRASYTESYTPRSSGLMRPPLGSSRLRTPRSNITRSSASPLLQSDIKRAMSTEELRHTSNEFPPRHLSRGGGGYSSRKALPRPSHSSGISSPKYVSPRNKPVKEFVSRAPPDLTQISPRSDPSDVWNDGEFF